MFHILNRRDQRKGAIAKVEFEGEPYGAGVSFFEGNLQPGKGPGLHKHPYPETCIVLSGQALMVVDGEEVVAGPGDIVVVWPETRHRFTAVGDGQLDMICNGPLAMPQALANEHISQEIVSSVSLRPVTASIRVS